VQQVEKKLVIEQKRLERQLDKQEAARQREQAKREREIAREVVSCVDKLLRRLEKEHASEGDEDGRPYYDAKPVARQSNARANVYRVRGAPCVDWLECDLPGTGRSAEAEAAFRAARSEEIAIKRAPKMAALTWVDPESAGRPWTQICLRLRVI